MASSSIFNELTNRLTQNKRHDSGIHNSSDNVAEKNNDGSAITRTEDQTDSGRESDQANELRKSKENLDKTKKKGIFSNIKKIFKKKTRKSKGGLSKSDENLASSYYKSASEPDITKEINAAERSDERHHKDTDLMSEPEDLKSPERGRSSLKEAPQYIRSSLRKLRLNKNKKTSATNIDVHVTETKKSHVADQPSPDDDVIQREDSQKSANDVFTIDVKREEVPLPAAGPVNLNEVSHATPQIETSAAKDRIRIAPQNRRRPTRFASKKPQSDRSGRSSPSSKRSEDENSFRSSYHSQEFGSPSIRSSSKENINKLSTSKTSLSSIGETKQSSVSDVPGMRGGLKKTSSLLGSLEFRKSNLFASQEFKNNSKPDLDESKEMQKPKQMERSMSLGKQTEPLVESKKPRPLAKPRHLSRQMSELRSKSMGNLSDMKDTKPTEVTETTRKTGASQGSMKNLSYKQPANSSNVSSEFTDILNEFQKSRERIFQKGNLKKRESESESTKNDDVENHEVKTTRKGEATFALTSKLITPEKPQKQINNLLITNDPNLRPDDKKEFVINASPPISPKNKSKTFNENKNDAKSSRNSVELSNISLRKVAKTSDFHEAKPETLDQSSENKKVSRIPSLKKASRKDEMRSETPDKPEETVESPKATIVYSPNTSKENSSKIPARKSVKAMSKLSDHSNETSHDKVSAVLSDPSESKIPAFSRVSLKKVPKSSDFHGIENQPLLTSEQKRADKDTENNTAKTESNFGFNRTLSIGKQSTKSPNSKDSEFTFQSRDLVRSKTLPTHDMKQYSRNGPKSPAPTSPEPESKIPEWVRIAKQKQQDGEGENNTKPAPVSPIKPQVSPDKPKLNPRPMSIPKMVPPAGNRSISPLKQHSKSFNTKSDVSKDTCIVCKKTAYMFEKCEVDKNTLHKTCAKCDVCARKLNVGAIFIHDNKVFCSQHK